MSTLEKIDKPHDMIFHDAMSNIEVATSFFMAHLPKSLQQQIDFSTLRLRDGKHVSPERRASHTDILYEVQIDHEQGYLALHVEHQSTARPLMPFRMLRYLCRIMEGDLKKQKGKEKDKKLPLVIPIVYYHGKESPYPYTTDIMDCFKQPELAKAYFLKPFQLVDLTQMPDNEIVTHGLVSVLELTHKYIFQRDFLAGLTTLLAHNLLGNLARSHRDLFLHLLQYIAEEGSIDDEAEFFNQLNKQLPEYRGDIVTVAQQLRQQAMQQGIQQGMQQGMQQGLEQKEMDIAKNLLAAGQPLSFIQQMTGISEEKLKQL